MELEWNLLVGIVCVVVFLIALSVFTMIRIFQEGGIVLPQVNLERKKENIFTGVGVSQEDFDHAIADDFAYFHDKYDEPETMSEEQRQIWNEFVGG